MSEPASDASPPGEPANTPLSSVRHDDTPVLVENLGLIDYQSAWELQRDLADRRADGLDRDRLLLLEHPSVFAAGQRAEPADLAIDGSPVVQVDRDGKLTWHGPGQLVGYPIVRLAEPVDVAEYVHRLEAAVIAVCGGFGVACGRVDGRSGVWVPADSVLPERKIAAIGVRVRRGVAVHGIALNCNSALEGFASTAPRAAGDAVATTLSRELDREVTVTEMLGPTAEAVLRALDGQLPGHEQAVVRVTTDGPRTGAPVDAE